MMNRRELLKAGVGAMPLLAGAAGLSEAAHAYGVTGEGLPLPSANASLPWQRQIRRAGQLNMTEHDPVSLDVEAWADYWANLKVGMTYISVTGIMAYYQTKVPFHKQGKFLGNRDVFGDRREASLIRGLLVTARLGPGLK